MPVKARSVPPRRATWYCSGVSWARHSASRLVTFSVAIGGGRSLRGLPDVGHHLPKAALELLLPRSGNEERQAGGPGRGLGVVLEGPCHPHLALVLCLPPELDRGGEHAAPGGVVRQENLESPHADVV